MILDLDTGIDDALAIAYALAAPECDLIGIVGSYGNVLVENGAQNSLNLLEMLGHPEVPVFCGLSHSSTTKSFSVMPISAQIHGKNGVGEVELKKAKRQIEKMSGVDFFIEAAHKYQGRLLIVPTGPLTNLAAAIKKGPLWARGRKGATTMQFFSTRDRNRVVSASQAIAQGLSDEGGLFVPQSFPQVDVQAICGLEYPEMAAAIVGQYLTDYSQQFLAEAAKATYGEAFGGKAGYLAPVSDSMYSLELWHGPTCAFKDYALQLMPKLLVEAKKNLNRTEKTLILVATSGDTGKAALDGYHDIPGVEIAVFFPTGGTSEIQRLQMATQEGENVAVYAVRGNFDDAQTGVKRVFGDGAIAAELAKRNIRLSSANSINWGRLVPQIVYYFAAYAQLLKAGKIAFGDKVDFCVPTGNFGDILAGYYAKQMGLPVGKLVCASNENNVLTDFLTSQPAFV